MTINLNQFAKSIKTGLLLLASSAVLTIANGTVVAEGETMTKNNNATEKPIPTAWAVQINVIDIDKAIEFYTETLGLEMLTKTYYPQVVSLKNDGGHILLYKVENQSDLKTREYRNYVNFQVNSLDEMTRKLKAAKAEILDDAIQRNAIGHHLVISDPSGNVIHLMELDKQYGTVENTKLFNVGINVTNLDDAIEFYEAKLGLKVMTHKYWPPILPLNCNGMEIVLHKSDKVAPLEYPGSTGAYLILEVPDIEKAMAELKSKGQSFEYDNVINHAPVGKYTALRDPFGNVIELIEPVDNPLDQARQASRAKGAVSSGK